MLAVSYRPTNTPMTPTDTVTDWLRQFRTGDREAVRKLWGRYYPRLVEQARRQLRGVPRRAADEEDVAADAFDSFCRGVEAGRCPDLDDRNGLWQLLLAMTANKAVDLVRYAGRDKRDWRRTVSADSPAPADADGGVEGLLRSDEPDPAFVLEVADRLNWLLSRLADGQLRQIALLKLEGYTNAEIAARLGCAVSTVERRLVLIRRRLEAAAGEGAGGGGGD